MCILPSSFAEAKPVRFCLQKRIFIRCEHEVNNYCGCTQTPRLFRLQ